MAETELMEESVLSPSHPETAIPHQTIIEVDKLEKRYRAGAIKAVDGISFGVSSGGVFGLLGPNGAGKTTTIGVLTTRVMPTGGRATVAGIDVVTDPVGVKPHIAVVPQRNNLDRSLTAIENLVFHAAYFSIGRRERHERAMNLLKEFGLSERANDKVDRYSGGMAQRLLIARALMHSPEVLFLDEPTTGLDPQARLFLWEVIEAFNHNGLTILLTTHDMEEAEKLCHRVAIMDRGKILALDTPANLSLLVPAGTRVELRVRTPDGAPLSDALKEAILNSVKSLPGVSEAEWTVARKAGRESGGGPPLWVAAMMAGGGAGKPAKGKGSPLPPGGPPAGPPGKQGQGDPQGEPRGEPQGESMLRLYAERSGELAVEAARIVVDRGLELADLHIAQPSLEDVFIHLTGRGLRD
jgi:ABC-2 type transport system ATP-binding protein